MPNAARLGKHLPLASGRSSRLMRRTDVWRTIVEVAEVGRQSTTMMQWRPAATRVFFHRVESIDAPQLAAGKRLAMTAVASFSNGTQFAFSINQFGLTSRQRADDTG
jgi:hypothetical protein